jgi:hypothetical protein
MGKRVRHECHPSQTRSLSQEDLIAAALELSSIAGVVGNVCDHVEHNEATDPMEVRVAGQRLRAIAVRLATSSGRSITDLYAERLRVIEARNVLHRDGGFDGAATVSETASWRELQLLQIEHDRFYHPDVVGLTKADQLRHYALHLPKLAAGAADTARGFTASDDFLGRRVPDMLLFGIKLATVTGEKLGDERPHSESPLPELAATYRERTF